MASTFDTLPEPECQRCGMEEEVVELELNGETHEVCRACESEIHRRRFRR